VKEAGGRVTNYDGEDYFMEGDSVVATNGVVHQALQDAVRAAQDAC
jgi:myo-inositol-1(or 4)-monophosphatase